METAATFCEPNDVVDPDIPLARNLSASAFAGLAADYARFRPPYPEELLADLLGRVAGRRRLLDLACGPGRIALQLASQFDEVWAIDSEKEMVDEGRSLAEQRGITNVTWSVGLAEELQAPAESFDLIAIGEAFHRLDQAAVVEAARRWLVRGGWLASIGSVGILQGQAAWQQRVQQLAREWTRDVFPNGWATGRPGSAAGPAAEAETMRNAGFQDVSSRTFPVPRRWSGDEVLGYLRTTSVCSVAVLGEKQPGFATAVRQALAEFEQGDGLVELMEFGYTAGRRP
jgi:ubiquinone/menaquinone biosynthesis C-methylase UbiE